MARHAIREPRRRRKPRASLKYTQKWWSRLWRECPGWSRRTRWTSRARRWSRGRSRSISSRSPDSSSESDMDSDGMLGWSASECKDCKDRLMATVACACPDSSDNLHDAWEWRGPCCLVRAHRQTRRCLFTPTRKEKIWHGDDPTPWATPAHCQCLLKLWQVFASTAGCS